MLNRVLLVEVVESFGGNAQMTEQFRAWDATQALCLTFLRPAPERSIDIIHDHGEAPRRLFLNFEISQRRVAERVQSCDHRLLALLVAVVAPEDGFDDALPVTRSDGAPGSRLGRATERFHEAIADEDVAFRAGCLLGCSRNLAYGQGKHEVGTRGEPRLRILGE